MEEQKRREEDHRAREGLVGSVHAPMYISDMKPLTHEAYGGGMYGKDDGGDRREEEEEEEEQQQQQQGQSAKPPASETQSADGPAVHPPEPKHKPPPSTGDRDLDITGQSYIQ